MLANNAINKACVDGYNYNYNNVLFKGLSILEAIS